MPVNVFRHVDNKELAEKLGTIAYLLDNNKIEYESGGMIFSGTKEEGYIGINGDIKLKFIEGSK